MVEAALLACGLILGGIVGWLWAGARVRAGLAQELADARTSVAGSEALMSEFRRQLEESNGRLTELQNRLSGEQQARVAAETRATEVARSIEEQRRLLDEAQDKLKEAFALVAREALKANTDDFAVQAAQKIEPLREVLARYESQIREMEQARQAAYGGLFEQVKAMKTAHDQMSAAQQQLSQHASNLVTALRAPQVKGRWGEITLQRVVELAGMSAHCDFTPQHTVAGEDGRRRPDMVVHLPGSRTIVIDAKAPNEAYLDAVGSADEAGRREHLRRHAQAVRSHMQSLSQKAYWNQFEAAPDFVVLFLPGESFFAAALEQDRTLIEDGIAARVIVATPTTLIALLRTVAHSWQQQQLVENARRIGETARLLFDRVTKFAEHLSRMGENLQKANESYNSAVGSYETRVLPMERRLAELGVATADADFLPFPSVDAVPRSVPRLEQIQ